MNLVSLYNRKKYVKEDEEENDQVIKLPPIRNYYNMDFKFIVRNKYYSVLLDLYKPLIINYENGQLVNDNPRLHFSEKELKEEYFKDMVLDLSSSSSSSTSFSYVSKEELEEFFKKFYYLNKQYLNTKQFKDIPIKSLDQNHTIQHQQQQQLKKQEQRQHQMQLYQLQQLQQQEHVVNTSIKVQNLDLLELTIFYSNYPFFKIVWSEYYCNFSLDSTKKSKYVDWCLMNGDIETLDYLYNKLGFKEFDERFAFQYACISENRENTLRYLFNVMGFKVNRFYVHLQSCILYKILQIEHSLYKQLNNCLSVDSIKSLEYLNLSNSLPFKQFLNLNLNINIQDPNFKSTLFRILNFDINLIDNNQLYYFNNLNNDNSNNNNQYLDNSNKLIKNFKNLFKSNNQKSSTSSSSSSTSSSSSSSSSSLSFDKLNLNNFNIKREIKRYYIYYNLLKQDSLETNLMLLKFIFKFIDKYEEYQLLDHLLYPDKFGYLQNTFLYNQYKQSINDNNNNSNNNNNNQKSKKKSNSDFGNNSPKITTTINESSSFSSSSSENNIYLIKKVIPVLSSYYTDLFIYIYNNKKSQFNYNHKNISINIASNQNFKLIKFLYENEIPIYEHILDTLDLNSLEIVEYLVSKGFKFTKVSFLNSIKNNNLDLFKFYIENSTDTQKEFIYTSINSFYTLFSDNLFFLKLLNHYIQNLILKESKFNSTIISLLKSKLILPNYLK